MILPEDVELHLALVRSPDRRVESPDGMTYMTWGTEYSLVIFADGSVLGGPTYAGAPVELNGGVWRRFADPAWVAERGMTRSDPVN